MTWQGRKLTRLMVETQGSRCPPDGNTAKTSDGLAHHASPMIPTTTLSTSRRKRRRDHLALTSVSSVARASSTVAAVGRMGVPLQRLACATVARATQVTYTKALGSLLAWLQVPTLPLWTTSQCDDQLARYVLWLFHQGAPRDEAIKVFCAVLWSRTTIPRPMSKGLPLASAALAGWRRLGPSTSRPPLPRPLLILIVTKLIAKIKYEQHSTFV